MKMTRFADLFRHVRMLPRPEANLRRGTACPGNAAPRASGRILGMEGLRAYAIWLVFLVHFLVQYFNGSTGPKRIDFDAFRLSQAQSAWDLAAYYFWASHYGVDLFFLLSGFLIFRVIVKQDFSYGAFLRARFARLYPAFAIALGIHILYIAVFWAKTFDWITIAQNLLLLHGIWELGIEPIVLPTWSLSYEWMFYLLFPLVVLYLAARRQVSVRHLAAVAIGVLILVVPIASHYMRLLMFFSGAILACIEGERMRAIEQQVPDLAVFVVYVAANLLFVAGQNWYYFVPVYFFTSFALVAKVVYGSGFLHKMFCWRPLRQLGNVSYSFYLFHGLAIIIVCDHAGPGLRGMAEPLRFALLLIGSFALSTAVAAVSYTLLERPYFERRLRWGVRAATAAASMNVNVGAS